VKPSQDEIGGEGLKATYTTYLNLATFLQKGTSPYLQIMKTGRGLSKLIAWFSSEQGSRFKGGIEIARRLRR